jgi:glycosyltransferase involved in cell wall biosynthesis
VWIRNQILRIQPNLLLTYNLGAASALMAARVLGSCPVIHTETGFSADEGVRPNRVRVLLRRFAATNVSAVVVPSRSLERIATTVFRLKTPVIRIPNGVDVRKLQPADGSPVRRRLGLNPGDFVIGCVGHLRAEKGHLRLFRAFHAAGIPDSKLLVLGDGPMRPALESAASEMGIASRVLFTGIVDDVPAWYPAMDLFALASDTEQMPMALLEAMACGLPAVCTDVGDCREILGPQAGPAVAALNDAAGFAEALRTFSRDEQLRRETGIRNRRRCVEEYDSEQMLAAYRDLYTRTICGNAQR